MLNHMPLSAIGGQVIQVYDYGGNQRAVPDGLGPPAGVLILAGLHDSLENLICIFERGLASGRAFVAAAAIFLAEAAGIDFGRAVKDGMPH